MTTEGADENLGLFYLSERMGCREETGFYSGGLSDSVRVMSDK